MSPENYAKELVKRNGKKEAARIASGTRKTMEIALMDPNPGAWGTPFSDEVTVSDQAELQNGKVFSRAVTVVDQAKKVDRLKSTLTFWVNVTNWLAKRYPEEFPGKIEKVG